MKPVLFLDSCMDIKFLFSFTFNPFMCTAIQKNFKFEIHYKLSLHKAFYTFIQLKDFELKISNTLFNDSIDLILTSDFENKNLKYQLL